MKSGKTVTVIGGGIAGLAAMVFLTEKGFRVSLYEASPKLGGRAYSFFDTEKKMFFDNGQHILAGWYRDTFDYLKITGSYDKVNFQKGLEVKFINTDKKVFTLKCPDKPAPMNLIEGLLKFNALGLKDKFSLKNIYGLVNDQSDLAGKYPNVKELLSGFGQTENLMKYFWKPFILAVFNSAPENVSVEVFMNVMKEGFSQTNNSVLVIPEVNLNELLIDDALKYIQEKKVAVFKDAQIKQVVFGKNDLVDHVLLDNGGKIHSDYYISAVSFFTFRRLFDQLDYEKNGYRAELFRTSSIVSVHLFFENKIPAELFGNGTFGMTGLIGTIVQWVFKRSDFHLSLVISGADHLQITDMKHEEVFRLCIEDLKKTIGGFSETMVSDYRIIKEKRATFVPDYLSNEFRLSQKTKYNNFFIAGDWTDTGLPATIESAVRSGRKCCELIASVS